jgi:autotransporter translocation and assembly factor TamB
MPDNKSLPTWAHVAIGISVILILFIFVFVITGGTSEGAQQVGYSIGKLLSPILAGAIVAAPVWWLVEKALSRRHPPVTLSQRNNWYLFLALSVLFAILASIRIYAHGSIF